MPRSADPFLGLSNEGQSQHFVVSIYFAYTENRSFDVIFSLCPSDMLVQP